MNADGATPSDRQPPEDEQLLAALRAADPARGASTDLAALRAAVDGRIASNRAGTPGRRMEGADDVGSSAAGVPAPDLESSGDDASATRHRSARKKRQWMLAAAVATMLAVGAGGYAIGAQHSQAPVVVADQGGAEETSAEELAPMSSESDEEASTREGADPGPSGPTDRLTFTDGGLPTDIGSAEAWVMDAASAYSEDRIAGIAVALGIDGEAEQLGGVWVVADQDPGRQVQIQSDGLATLIYRDSTVDVPCADGDEELAGTLEDEAGGASPYPTEEEPAGRDHCEPDLDASEPVEDPEGTAQEFLDVLGVDSSALGLTVERVEPAERWAVVTASADSHDHGQPVWNLTVSADGVTYAQGPLAEPVTLGDYPTISAAQAMERLTDPAYPTERIASTVELPTAEPGAAVPEPGSDLPWPVREAVLSEATLTVDAYSAEDGGQILLLPTWELRDDDQNSWRVLAVEASVLDTS